MKLVLGHGVVACRHFLKRTSWRCFSSTSTWSSGGKSSDAHTYADTLFLPQTKFVHRPDPSTYERLRERTCDKLYREQWNQADNPLFVLHDGPPYANGDLHIGHALNKILKDIINRYHVLLGHRVHYIPGWDCHGLPIENKVLKKLKKNAEDLTPQTIRTEAEAFAKEEIARQRDQFRLFGIMADWSPESTYRTLDHDYEMRQLKVFKTMVEKGLIYRQLRPVYYSPSSRTALAEGELTYNEKHTSHTVYVAFELDPDSPNMSTALKALVNGQRKVRLLVWTTTPWTLTANMGIAVNPEMMYEAVAESDDPTASVDIFAVERETELVDILGTTISNVPVAEFPGSDLVGATYRPLFLTLNDAESVKSLPVVPSSHVTPNTGTGLVHCAPAHGDEDYNVFHSLGLLSSSSDASSGDLLCHVDVTGRFTEGVADVVGHKAAKGLAGQEVLADGGKAIVGLLEEVGALRKLQRIRHSYPYDWRTDQPIIVIATSQWFANTDHIKDDALLAVQGITPHPAGSHSRLAIDVRNRSEWCISRQRAWGVPIPALHHIPSGRAVLDAESLTHILRILQEKRTSYWWEGPVAEFVPPGLRDGMDDQQLEETWQKGTDTMDVWFDSGSSWTMLEDLYADGTTSVTGRRFGADVCLEGRDQHRGWFQSQLLTAVATAPDAERKRQAPYTTLITHGMTVDERGRKMSKSLGNVISPMSIINGGESKKDQVQYGPEVLRLWTANVKFTEDMPISHSVLQHCQYMYLKIRNAARYVLGSLHDQPYSEKVERDGLGLIDRYVMHELYKLEDTAMKSYATYDFARVVSSISQFVITMFSPVYVDTSKDCLYAAAKDSPERRAMLAVLAQVLDTMTTVVSPILPYLAEEIHETLHGGSSSVFSKKWTPLSAHWDDPGVEWQMGHLLRLRAQILSALEKARKEKLLRRSPEADVFLTLPDDVSSEAHDVVELIRNHVNDIKALSIVSNVSVGPQPSETPAWKYTSSLKLPGCDRTVDITVRPATLHKCPRCWLHTREENEALCGRCSTVVSH
ncbi:isoleucyl-tRNA synthetase [Fomitopsis serialis]|uniref:isoleucyl-tRNA synthetase n=1 Tax=Fomitopsis serialis TaxID=139415 RepID=UPI00200723A2|nr:isoleucyl-tRNA synthetase [Neoantrodia serialis]KAH9926739.1 isoleucyl-tRNA synthetase [Neoantrodia serialis]